MSQPDPAVAVRRAALRQATLHLVLGVVAVHGVALLLFYGLHVSGSRHQTAFVAVWTFATAITVAFLLRRVRLVRRSGRGRPRN